LPWMVTVVHGGAPKRVTQRLPIPGGGGG
jgi:hypothetical protein